jgi:putative restriction endonuclease
VIYYEPRRHDSTESGRLGRQAYFATALVTRIEPDPGRSDHYYAFVTDYPEFEQPVSFRDRNHYFESALQRSDGGTNRGAFGRAVRFLPDREYELILAAGFSRLVTESSVTSETAELYEEPATFERRLIEQIAFRPFRDQAFARAVQSAYEATCAMTGLKVLNGLGRAEAQAAHIRPVADRGPDSVRNGLALCGTVHWMFDRGLVTVDDQYNIVTARRKVPLELTKLLNPEMRLRLPKTRELWPHPQFLRYHRENVFKG